MAEARVEELQEQVTELQERVEELTLDLEITRGERQEAGESAGGASLVELEQLKEQNARFKEALITLRDTSNKEKAEMAQRLKSLEKMAKEHPDLVARCARFKQEAQENAELVEGLREQLEDANTAHSLVDELTEKVMRLEDRISDQLATIEDLEALRALSEELEEGHVENEKQMQADIEYKDTIILQQQTNMERVQETNSEYEQTIFKFRDLVRGLQADIERLRCAFLVLFMHYSHARGHRESQQEVASETLESQSQTMENIKLELQSTNLKAQSKCTRGCMFVSRSNPCNS